MEVENTAFQSVLENDLIMIRILRLLNLREQCEIQKINERFEDLIRTRIWIEDYQEVQMNCRQLAYLSDGEFFEFLKWNANNIQRLTIIEDDGSNVQRYFPAAYENLLQLRIKGILLNDLEFEHIANNCPKLQSFAYNANRESYDLQDKEFIQCLQLSQSYESFLLFKHLKTLILRDLLLKISYETLQIFAFGLQLERFEWHNLEVKPIERNFKKFRNLKFEKLKVLKIANVSSEKECWDFIEKCGNLRELNCQWPRNIALDVKFFDRFWQMEKLTLKGHTFMPSLEMIIVKLRNLKYLNIGEVDQEKEEMEEEGKGLENLPEAPEGVNKAYAHLRILRINLSHYPEDFRFLLSFLEKPKTILENLHSLSLSNSAINDEFIWLLTLKCQHLRELNLKYSQISGKYMNRMKKLQSLQLVKNKKAIPWSQLYCLLAELYQLEHLLLDELILSKDDWVITSNLPDFGNSWKCLKITQLNKQMDFWLYILQRSRGGFESLQSLDIGQYSTRGLVDFLICFRVPNLTLQACHKLYKDSPNLTILLSIYLKELTLIDCRGLTWPDIILILSSSKVEKFHMFNMPSIKIDYATRRPDDNEMEKIVENLRTLTLPYELFSQTAETWQELCLACPHFRLCCLGQYGQAVVLDMLLETAELKEKVKAISANMELELLKNYCAENLNTTSSNVPVYLLDAENKKMWNPHFSNANGDLIIIIEM